MENFFLMRNSRKVTFAARIQAFISVVLIWPSMASAQTTDPDSEFRLALIVRVSERIGITVIIVSISLILLVAFWRSLQKVDFAFETEGGVTKANVILATPVFVLLILVGYAYVTFSFPMTLEAPQESSVIAAENDPPNRNSARTFMFLGGSEDGVLEFSQAVSTLLLVQEFGQFKDVAPLHQTRLERALNVIENARADVIANSLGTNALRLWNQSGESYLLDPTNVAQSDRRKLEELLKWYSPFDP